MISGAIIESKYGLYAQSEFFNQVRSNGKDVLAVLKDVQRDLLKDARSLFDDTPPSGTCTDRGRRECGDLDGSTIWTQCQYPVRVVRSYETK